MTKGGVTRDCSMKEKKMPNPPSVPVLDGRVRESAPAITARLDPPSLRRIPLPSSPIQLNRLQLTPHARRLILILVSERANKRIDDVRALDVNRDGERQVLEWHRLEVVEDIGRVATAVELEVGQEGTVCDERGEEGRRRL